MTDTGSTVKTMTLTALMAAFLCVLGPFSIPLPGLVPISLTNLGLYLIVYLLGWKRSLVSYLLYLLIGAVGIPVFSGFAGGLHKLVGPTGGYLFGFLLMTAVCGFAVEKAPTRRTIQIVGMIVGTLGAYLFGTLWLARVAHLSFAAALAAGVLPFIPGDFLKIVLAVMVGPMLRDRLIRARLIAPLA